jgi:uncharacterized protein YjbJ (UPF0337 family)
MNEDILKGKWKQLKGGIKEHWGNLTDDEMDQIDGRRERLAGKLQEKYGYTRAEAETEIDNFLRDYDRNMTTHHDDDLRRDTY